MPAVRPPIDGGTILITGASAGIGEALARELAPRAGVLVLVARRAARIEALRSELEAGNPALAVHAIPCDLADQGAVDGLVAELSARDLQVDVLINNAGLGHNALFDRAARPALERIIKVNVLALTMLTSALVPAMVARGRGGVLNVGSGAGFSVFPAGATYIGSKHFVHGFTEALRLDLDGTGVAVTQVCPGPVATEFSEVASGGRESAREVLGPAGGLRMSAARCAREALAGFEHGRAVVVPGRRFGALMLLVRSVMREGAQRRVMAPTARRIRARRPQAQPRTPR
jgi:uncharacterized protein